MSEKKSSVPHAMAHLGVMISWISRASHNNVSGPRVISALLIDPTQVESKKSS